MSFAPAGGGGPYAPGAASLTASGTASAPTAGSTIASIPAASLPPGSYQVAVTGVITGANEVAPLNLRLLNGAVGLNDIPNGGAQNVPIPNSIPRVTLDGINTLKLVAIANATAATVYTYTIQATRVS